MGLSGRGREKEDDRGERTLITYNVLTAVRFVFRLHTNSLSCIRSLENWVILNISLKGPLLLSRAPNLRMKWTNWFTKLSSTSQSGLTRSQSSKLAINGFSTSVFPNFYNSTGSSLHTL